MALAIGALVEVLKFIPRGADAVPEESISSDLGRKVYASEPGRFGRARLEAVIGAYRDVLAGYSGLH